MKPADEARDLLVRLGAPEGLITHTCLVGEAAELLLAQLRRLAVPHDAEFIRAAVVLHDAGKILHPDELRAGGSEHEAAGEKLLLAHRVDPPLARCCRSHSQWDRMACTLEELLVALADNLWQGKRSPALEERLIEGIGERLGREFWDLFVELDSSFETIAAGGAARAAAQPVGSRLQRLRFAARPHECRRPAYRRGLRRGLSGAGERPAPLPLFTCSLAKPASWA